MMDMGPSAGNGWRRSRVLRAPVALTGVAAALLIAVACSACGPSAAHVPHFAFVALGDSFTAGEGLAPYLRDGFDSVTGKQGLIANGCHRSPRSYPSWVQPPGFTGSLYAIASGRGKPGAGNTYGSETNVRSAAGVTWASWSCSGATTTNLLPRSLGGLPQTDVGPGSDPRTQLDSADLSGANLVTLTLGGNDAGYIEVLVACALGGCNTPSFERRRREIVDRIQPRLEKVYAALAQQAPLARILVLGYPQAFPAAKAEQNCSTLRLFVGEQDLLRRLGAHLNDTIRSAVRAVARTGARIEFVPVAARFAGHEICGRKGPWMNGFLFNRSGFGLGSGSFHPNAMGQRDGYAAAVDAALR